MSNEFDKHPSRTVRDFTCDPPIVREIREAYLKSFAYRRKYAPIVDRQPGDDFEEDEHVPV